MLESLLNLHFSDYRQNSTIEPFWVRGSFGLNFKNLQQIIRDDHFGESKKSFLSLVSKRKGNGLPWLTIEYKAENKKIRGSFIRSKKKVWNANSCCDQLFFDLIWFDFRLFSSSRIVNLNANDSIFWWLNLHTHREREKEGAIFAHMYTLDINLSRSKAGSERGRGGGGLGECGRANRRWHDMVMVVNIK